MRAKTNRIPILVLTVTGATAGFVLRRWQLGRAFDAEGLVVPGCASIWLLAVFCILMAAALALVCSTLRRRGEYEACFSSGLPELVISVAAALLVLLGSVISLMADPQGSNLVVGFLGICAALCIAVTAAQRYRGVMPSAAVHILPCVYLVVKLIVDFKHWSVDPAVLDYCFELFAAISFMCAVYHLGGFCFQKGKRRMSAFWCLVGILFAAISLADGGLSHSFLVGGMGLWVGINGWQLLED